MVFYVISLYSQSSFYIDNNNKITLIEYRKDMNTPVLMVLHEFIKTEINRYSTEDTTHQLIGSIRGFGRRLGQKIMMKILMEKELVDFKNESFKILSMMYNDFWTFAFSRKGEAYTKYKRKISFIDRDFEFLGRIEATTNGDVKRTSSNGNQNEFVSMCLLLLTSLVEGACENFEHKIEFESIWKGDHWLFEFRLA